ncbi:MAG: group III truncated hemoglobin [Bacteroidetes bacterium]|nr:group III truncated hemoglobin [Bacteroidota bacterium]
MLQDIGTLDDIKQLVNRFYDQVRADTLLGLVFETRIENRWPKHLEKMYSFWQTVLLGEHTYEGRPFPPHAELPVDHQHFAQWMQLFTATIDEMFAGNKTEEAKWRAARMAEMFEMKLEHYRQTGGKNLV